jgi:hypothetical protein
MVIRFDFIQLSENPHIDPVTGFLRCRATIARSGIQEYADARYPNGIRREYRPPDEVEKSAVTFNNAVATLDHPPVMVNKDNSATFLKGYGSVVEYLNGLLETDLTIVDPVAIAAAQSTHKELSNGYECDIDETPGACAEGRYDVVQRNIRGNHIALVERARAGSIARLHLDSAEDVQSCCQIRTDANGKSSCFCVLDSADGHTMVQNPKSRPDTHQRQANRMATLRIDSVEYTDVPADIAGAVSLKIAELSTLKQRADSLETDNAALKTKITQLEDNLDEITDERDSQTGRADALEVEVEALRYTKEGAANTARADAAPEETGISEEDFIAALKVGIDEGIAVRLDAYTILSATDADLSEIHFDSSLAPVEVKAQVLQMVRPNSLARLDAEDANLDIHISARFDALLEEVEQMEDGEPEEVEAAADQRSDSARFDSRTATTAARKAGTPGAEAAHGLDEACRKKMDAYKQPMSLSKA